MTIAINTEDEFNSSIKQIYNIILEFQGNLPGLDTPRGKELQMLISMAFVYVQRTDPSNPDPMEAIMQRLKQVEGTGL